MTGLQVIVQLLTNCKPTIHKNNLIYKDIFFKDFNTVDNPFDICCYTNIATKLAQLYKQYFDKDSWEHMVKNKETCPMNICTISMIGGPKWGTTKNNRHCISFLTINHKEQCVNVYFRNSDFFKKFLIDIAFIQELMVKYGIGYYKINCNFEKLTLRIPFAYIYLNQLYKDQGIDVVKLNPLFQDFIEYSKSIKNKKQSGKSLERANRYMMKTSLYKEVLKDLI